MIFAGHVRRCEQRRFISSKIYFPSDRKRRVLLLHSDDQTRQTTERPESCKNSRERQRTQTFVFGNCLPWTGNFNFWPIVLTDSVVDLWRSQAVNLPGHYFNEGTLCLGFTARNKRSHRMLYKRYS